MSKLRSASVTKPNARDEVESPWGRGTPEWPGNTNGVQANKKVNVNEDENKTVGKSAHRIILYVSHSSYSPTIFLRTDFLLYESISIKNGERF